MGTETRCCGNGWRRINFPSFSSLKADTHYPNGTYTNGSVYRPLVCRRLDSGRKWQGRSPEVKQRSLKSTVTTGPIRWIAEVTLWRCKCLQHKTTDYIRRLNAGNELNSSVSLYHRTATSYHQYRHLSPSSHPKANLHEICNVKQTVVELISRRAWQINVKYT